MSDPGSPRRVPSTVGEEVANALTHGVGAVLSVVGVLMLAERAAASGDPWRVGSTLVFGVAAVALYVVSTCYHALAHTRARHALKVCDHALIYVLIAGTYTPFMLVHLRDGLGWWLFGVLWATAAVGVWFQVRFTDRYRRESTLLYLGMGWIGVIAVGDLLEVVGTEPVLWLLGGGALYTVGTAFYVWRGQRYHHAVWHVFVLLGTACHFVAVSGAIC